MHKISELCVVLDNFWLWKKVSGALNLDFNRLFDFSTQCSMQNDLF